MESKDKVKKTIQKKETSKKLASKEKAVKVFPQKDNQKKKKIERIKEGFVISDKMDKTIVVKVERLKKHPLYKKYYKVNRKFKVHDPENKAEIGDKVEIRETRPLSKGKYWELVRIKKK